MKEHTTRLRHSNVSWPSRSVCVCLALCLSVCLSVTLTLALSLSLSQGAVSGPRQARLVGTNHHHDRASETRHHVHVTVFRPYVHVPVPLALPRCFHAVFVSCMPPKRINSSESFQAARNGSRRMHTVPPSHPTQIVSPWHLLRPHEADQTTILNDWTLQKLKSVYYM